MPKTNEERQGASKTVAGRTRIKGRRGEGGDRIFKWEGQGRGYFK